jgi:hypothetical protein
MRYAVQPRGAAERLALWLGLAPLPVIDVLVPLLQVRCIMAAVKLGVFEALRAEARTTAELAGALRLDREVLELLLRVLASSRYLKARGGCYGLTRLARATLVRGSARELCSYVELNYEQWRMIEGLETALQSGRGADFHAQLPASSQTWRLYQRAMLELARPVADVLARHVPVPAGAARLLDLGGGHGLFGAALCRAHPPLTSTVIELEPALPEAERLARAEGIADLVSHRAGDVTECRLEPSTDVVLLCNLLHHLTRDAQAGLLGRVLTSLAPGGTIAIWEPEAQARGSAPELAGDAIGLYFRLTSSAPALDAPGLSATLSRLGFERLELLRPLAARGWFLLHARKPQVKAGLGRRRSRTQR